MADLERFLRARRSRDVLTEESSSVAEADADAVSVPLTPTELADFVYTRERRAALSGSADCERGMREGCSGVTGVERTSSSTWSAGGRGSTASVAAGEGESGDADVGCAIEPLSETSISITEFAEAEGDNVSSNGWAGISSELTSEGVGSLSRIELTSC